MTGLFKRARACLEKSVDLGRKAQRAVPVVHDVCGNRCMEVKEGNAPPWPSLCVYQ